MPANQFQSFGLGAGAYVMSPASWASSGARQQGYAPGIAAKEVINTALRQSSAVTSMLAAFVAAHQPADVLDDGNLIGLQAQLKAALDSLYGAAGGNAPVGGSAFNEIWDGSVVALQLTLQLPPGTWLVSVDCGIFSSVYWAMALRVNGSLVQQTANHGDPTGIDFVTMGGTLSVTNPGPGNLAAVVAFSQEAGGNSSPAHLKAVAFRTA